MTKKSCVARHGDVSACSCASVVINEGPGGEEMRSRGGGWFNVLWSTIFVCQEDAKIDGNYGNDDAGERNW